MKTLLKIGITGGIGSGKSTVCKVFSSLGIPIYEADSRAKWLMTNDEILKNKIKDAFGKESYFENGDLNRNFLAQQVFNQGDKVKILNSLVHPQVGIDYLNWIEKNSKSPYVLNEAALMFESGSYQRLDKVITVFAPDTIRLERVSNRDPHRSREEIKGIMQKQIPEEEKIKRADYVIYNDGKQLIIPQVLKLHQLFTNTNVIH